MKTKNFKFKSMALVLFALVLSSNVWADYTVTFNTASTDGSNVSTKVSDYVNSSSTSYVSSITTSKAYYNGKSGVKLGASSGTGNIVLTLSTTSQVNASSISIVSATYDAGKTFKCTVTYTDNTTADQTFSFGAASASISLNSAKKVKSVKFESITSSKGRGYISSFTITTSSSDTWKLMGLGDWSTGLTFDANGECTKNLSANTTYTGDATGFKIVKNSSTWYGNNGTMNSGNCTNWEFTTSGGNASITTTRAGEYKFKMSVNGSGNPVLSVTYPADTWQLAGFDNWGNKIDFVNGSCQVNLTAKTYTAATDAGFKLIKNGSDYYGCNGTMTRSSCTNWTFYTGNDNKNCGITADVAGTYTFTINTSSTNPQLSVTYPTKYTVTYNGNGNTSGSAPAAVDYANGATVTVAGNTGSLAKTGYDFGGWNTKADGTGTNYTAGSGTFTISANTTLYAKWTIKSYTVTKGTITGGSATVPSSVNHGADVTLTGLTPDANHKLPYTITVTGNYGSIEGATIKNVTGAITVNVAFTEKETYTVTFYNAGEVVKTVSNVAEGTLFSAIKPTIGTGSGQLNIESCDNNSPHFMGWTTEESFQKRDNAPSYVDDGTAINGNMTVRAVWAAEQ
ncbi:MAG: InlB B-repeat-containing protein [Paludibacteraceae bacterium]|nr:InlB B-repeat-containing protein [Paludibacteraceae bacterium]